MRILNEGRQGDILTERRWIMVSFYTVKTDYEREFENLKKSVDKFNLPFRLFTYEPTGTWRSNLNYKSASILSALKEYPDKDIVFVDADAVVRQDPVLFDELSEKKEYDIAAHFYHYRRRSGDADELLSGTLWIQNNDSGRSIVERWHELGLRWSDVRHQKCLKIAILYSVRDGINIRVYRLPFEYTCIFDAGQRRGTIPVIEHFQASRRLRREVGYGHILINNPATIRRERQREMGFHGMLTTENVRNWKKRLSSMRDTV